METPRKRLKLIVTDVELTGCSPGTTSYNYNSVEIDILKELKPRVRALLKKNLKSIVHSRPITNSDQRLKLTVSDVQFSNSNEVEWRTSRPYSIVNVEVDQGLEPLARDGVKSTLDRLEEFYVVDQVRLGRLIIDSALKQPAMIRVFNVFGKVYENVFVSKSHLKTE
ncbi:hypothetical protein CASFOL_016266 [Castilleja foliolosa]|uniref:Uncharacterized protein n=1 Tax=Castilleja foliolosa TaxID=1961234 RepID=A0ABD3DGQ2_9LAMI